MLSIIVCTYNRERYIGKTLELLMAQCRQNEVLIIDNNSTDQTAEICQAMVEKATSKGLQFRYVFEARQGLSHARNRGIEEAKGDWLVFLDDDSFIQPGFVSTLETQLRVRPEMVAYGGRIDPLYESGQEPAWMSKWSYSWVSAINMGDLILPFKGTQYPIGANMGVRADVARAVKGFNPHLGRSGKNTMGGEEKDFFNKIRERIEEECLIKGKAPSDPILYLPGVMVKHCIPESRTSHEFIARLGDGVGASEKQRTLDIGKGSYLKRLLMECVKWCGTLALWLGFLFCGKKAKGDVLVVFRYHVTKKLL